MMVASDVKDIIKQEGTGLNIQFRAIYIKWDLCAKHVDTYTQKHHEASVFHSFSIDQKCGYHRQMRTGQCQQTASMRHGKQVKLSQVFGSRSYWIPMWDWTYWICLNFLRILELACQLLCYAPLWDIVRTIQIIYDWSTTFVIRAAKLDRLYTVYCSLINSL